MELYQEGRVAEAVEYDVILSAFLLKSMMDEGYTNGGESGIKYERGLRHVLDRMLHVAPEHAKGKSLVEELEKMKRIREQVQVQGTDAIAGDIKTKFAKKTIALVANAGGPSQFPCVGYGGVEIAVESLAWAMHNAGLRFFVVVPPRTQKTAYPFRVLEAGPVDCTGGSGITSFIEGAKQLIRLEQASQDGVDAIWAQSHWSLQLADLGIPLLVTFHDSIEKQPGTLLGSSSPSSATYSNDQQSQSSSKSQAG
jgi:hypothetical protein